MASNAVKWNEITQGLKVFRKEKGTHNWVLEWSPAFKGWRTEEWPVQMTEKEQPEGKRNPEKWVSWKTGKESVLVGKECAMPIPWCVADFRSQKTDIIVRDLMAHKAENISYLTL